MKKLSLTILLLAALLSGCSREAGEPAEEALPVVGLVTAEYSAYRPSIRISGVIRAAGKADAAPSSEGRIIELYAEEGDRVGRGQELGRLDDTRLKMRRRELEADLAVMENRLSLARGRLLEGERAVEGRLKKLELQSRDLEELKRRLSETRTVYHHKGALHEMGGISDRELERLEHNLLSAENDVYQGTGQYEIERIGLRDCDLRAAGFAVPADPGERDTLLIHINTATLRSEVDSAAAELEKVRVQIASVDLLLRETRLLSPLAGTVGLRLLGVGEKAGPEMPVFTIFSDDRYYAVGRVSETDIPDLRQGLEAEIACSNGRRLTGRVELISPYVEAESRSVEVKVLLSGKDPALLPGLYADIRIFTGPEEQVLRVPRSALTEDGRVFVYTEGHVFSRPVTREPLDGDTLIIRSGLEEGDIICERTTRYLRDGARVQPRQ